MDERDYIALNKDLNKMKSGRIKSEIIKKSRRNRECYNCGCTIKKGSTYGNRLISYDRRFITYNFCLAEICTPNTFKTK